MSRKGGRFMKEDTIKVWLLLFAVTFIMAGCAGGKKLKQDINLLRTQVGGLTTEMSRISEESKFTQEALRAEEERHDQLEQEIAAWQEKMGVGRSSAVTTQAGVYRTPSGFELQATDLQAALKNAGYYDGAIDGRVGDGTMEAIRRFQVDNGLDADGICGRKTWDKLKSFAENPVK